MQHEWPPEELEAAVKSYLMVADAVSNGGTVKKKLIYAKLSDEFGRTPKAYEYRMQNISYVLSMQGRQWVPGWTPASHVGAHVAEKIENLLAKLEGVQSNIDIALNANVNRLLERKS